MQDCFVAGSQEHMRAFPKNSPVITLQSRPYEADSAFGLSRAEPLSYRRHKCHIVQLEVVHFAALFKAALDVVMGNSLSARPHQ